MAGSQKGLMTPPGLGFVAAGPRAKQAHKTAGLRSPYWDWTLREGELHYQKYAGTPPEHLLFALRAALDLIFAEGLENVFHRHRLLAEATRRAVGTWAEGQSIGFNVSEPEERSDTVTAVVTRGGESAQPLVDYCREKCGVVLGRALGKSEGKGFRIAHMGHVNAPMILGTLSVVEMALSALGIAAPQGRHPGSGGVSGQERPGERIVIAGRKDTQPRFAAGSPGHGLSKTWMAGRKGVYARLRRAMPGHDENEDR